MTVREAKNICNKVTLSDCIFFEGTTVISGIKPSCDVSYEKLREAWKRLERFYGFRWSGKGFVK